MYGPGAAPPQPRPAGRGAVIGLRVLFTALTLGLFGILAWAAMLRLAILRRGGLDWALFGLVLTLSTGSFIVIGSAPRESVESDAALGVLIFLAFGVCAYYLTVDIRHHEALRRSYVPQPYAPPQPYALHEPYAPPSYASPHPYAPHHQAAPPQPPADPRPPGPGPAAPHGPTSSGYGPPGGVPHGTTPHRHSDSVRAELDELSDYLRREEGR